MTAVIDIKNASHRYKERLALDNVSFSVGDELFGIIGPNGSGKSTLFRLLSTLVPCQEGKLRIFGSVADTSENAIRAQLGVVFQTLSLDKKLTVEENLEYYGTVFGLEPGVLSQRVEKLLRLMDLTDRRRDIVEKLSGGLKRRLDIARALIHKPKLLLLDEPSAGLDPLVRRELMELLKEIRSQGVTVVLVTHHLDEAQLCDRVAFLDEGRLVALTSPATMAKEVSGLVCSFQTDRPVELVELLKQQYALTATQVGSEVRFRHPAAENIVGQLLQRHRDSFQSLNVGKPSLEDFFIEKTGRRMCLTEA